jgi:hypothetical protein
MIGAGFRFIEEANGQAADEAHARGEAETAT